MGAYQVVCIEKLDGIGHVEWMLDQINHERPLVRANVSIELDGFQNYFGNATFGPERFTGSIRFAAQSDGREVPRDKNVTLCLSDGRKLPIRIIENDPDGDRPNDNCRYRVGSVVRVG
jgi:hypothetical protein